MRLAELARETPLACEWDRENRVPFGHKEQEQAGKGEAKYAENQRLLGFSSLIVDGRGIDNHTTFNGELIRGELKSVDGDTRILVGDVGACAVFPFLRRAEDFVEKMDRIVRSQPDIFDPTLFPDMERLRKNFGARSISSNDWRIVSEYALIVSSYMTDESIIDERDPWFVDPSLIMQDVATTPATSFFSTCDLVILVSSQGFMLIPHWHMDLFLQFHGAVNRACPKLKTLAGPRKKYEHWLREKSEIVSHTERMYEYVVKYRSSNAGI